MTKRAAVLLPSQLRHLIRVTEATSRHPERDVLILWLGFSCGMRVTETARLTVADVLLPSGRLRSEISLRAEITKGCRQRQPPTNCTSPIRKWSHLSLLLVTQP